ncbi:hypothetical protein BH11ACT8_BH11ACT8_11900 [soil metagenome]
MVLEPISAPFADPPVAEVPLGRSPLVSVLFQVRFPGVASRIVQQLDANVIQQALADSFPFATQEQSFSLLVQPGQPPMQQAAGKVWVLHNADRTWTANIAGDSVALTTTAYESRQDFLQRAELFLKVIEETTGVPAMNRLGVRYLNRVAELNVDGQDWLQNLAIGARGILHEAATFPEHRPHVVQAQSQMLYKWPPPTSHNLQCTWGLVPPNVVTDPNMEPVAGESWLLDLDAFIEGQRSFHANSVVQQIDELANRAYRFFRWVLPPAALARFEPKDL